MPELNPIIERHLTLSGKLLDCIERALDDPGELFTTVVHHKSTKTDEEETYGVVRDCIDEKKLCGIVDAVVMLKDIQRQALGLMDPKDSARYDAELMKRNAPSENAIASFIAALEGREE